MPIPATCTVPAGEYDSYVPFEERVLTKAWMCLWHRTGPEYYSNGYVQTGPGYGIDFIRCASAPTKRSDAFNPLPSLVAEIDYEYIKVWEVPEWTMPGINAVAVTSVHEIDPIDEDADSLANYQTLEFLTDPSAFSAAEMFNNFGAQYVRPSGAVVTAMDVQTVNPWQADPDPWDPENPDKDVKGYLDSIHYLGNIYPSVATSFFAGFNGKSRDTTDIFAHGYKLDFSHCTNFDSMFTQSGNFKANTLNRLSTDGDEPLPAIRWNAILNSEDLVNAKSTNSMFKGMRYVGLGAAGESYSYYLFEWIATLKLPKLDSFTHMFDSLSHQYNLDILDISGWGCENDLIGDDAFAKFYTTIINASGLKLSGQNLFRNTGAYNVAINNCELYGPYTQMFANSTNLARIIAEGATVASGNQFYSNTFSGCGKLMHLDISWMPETIIIATNMFMGCAELTTIYSNHNVTVENPVNSTFTGCAALVGGAGTSFANGEITSSEYLRIDNPPDEPGYLTAKD